MSTEVPPQAPPLRVPGSDLGGFDAWLHSVVPARVRPEAGSDGTVSVKTVQGLETSTEDVAVVAVVTPSGIRSETLSHLVLPSGKTASFTEPVAYRPLSERTI